MPKPALRDAPSSDLASRHPGNAVLVIALSLQRRQLGQPLFRHVLGQSLRGAVDFRRKPTLLLKHMARVQPAATGGLEIGIGTGKSAVNVDLRTEQSIYGPVKSILTEVELERPSVKVRAQNSDVYDLASPVVKRPYSSG